MNVGLGWLVFIILIAGLFGYMIGYGKGAYDMGMVGVKVVRNLLEKDHVIVQWDDAYIAQLLVIYKSQLYDQISKDINVTGLLCT